MSFIANQLFSNLLAKQPGSIENDLHSLILGFNVLENALNRNADLIPKPQIFLKSANNNLSSNVADGVLILAGMRIPQNHRASVEDFNVNFTTVAGTVRLVILDSNDTIITDVLRSVASTTNGTGKTVLEQGQALAVVGQSAGAGVFSVYCSGTIQKVT